MKLDIQYVRRSLQALSSRSDEWIALSDAARSAADPACNSVEDAMTFVAASEKRIRAMELKSSGCAEIDLFQGARNLLRVVV